jgi:predicted small secreted protein
MRPALGSLLALAVLLAGCAKHETVQGDLRDAGHQAQQTVTDVAHDPHLHQAEAQLRQAGRDASHDLHKAAEEARSALRQLGHDVRRTHTQTAHDDGRTDS